MSSFQPTDFEPISKDNGFQPTDFEPINPQYNSAIPAPQSPSYSIEGFARNLAPSFFNTAKGLGSFALHLLDPRVAQNSAVQTVQSGLGLGIKAGRKLAENLPGKLGELGRAGSASIPELPEEKMAGSQLQSVANLVSPDAWYKDPFGNATTLGFLLQGAGQLGSEVGTMANLPKLTKVSGTVGNIGYKINPATGIYEMGKSLVPSALIQPLQSYKDNLNQFFTNTKAGTKAVTKEQIMGKDTSDFLANKVLESPPNERNIYLNPIEEGKFRPQKINNLLQRDANIAEDLLQNVLDENKGTTQFNLEKLRQQALDKVNNSFRANRNEVPAAQNLVNEQFNGYIDTYGNTVDASLANQMKRGQYSLGWNDFNPLKSSQGLQKSVARDIGNVFMNNIEKAIPDADIQGLNKYISDHVNTIDFLKDFNGNTLKGGKMTRFFSRLIGLGTGEALGNAVGGPMGGFIGAVTGTVGADKIASYLADTSISGNLKGALIKQLQQTNPQILDDVKAYIQQKGMESQTRLMLPPESPMGTSQNPIPGQPPPFNPRAGQFHANNYYNQQQYQNTPKLPSPDLTRNYDINQGRPIPVAPSNVEYTGPEKTVAQSSLEKFIPKSAQDFSNTPIQSAVKSFQYNTPAQLKFQGFEKAANIIKNLDLSKVTSMDDLVNTVYSKLGKFVSNKPLMDSVDTWLEQSRAIHEFQKNPSSLTNQWNVLKK